jgi:release factor glutamine methyltransferase
VIRIMKRARGLVHLLKHRRLESDLNASRAFEILGLTLDAARGVLHPGHFASSRRLGEFLERQDLDGKRVVDVGTGSGILGLVAARAGAFVIAIDRNPAAALLAVANGARNGLTHRFRVIR